MERLVTWTGDLKLDAMEGLRKLKLFEPGEPSLTTSTRKKHLGLQEGTPVVMTRTKLKFWSRHFSNWIKKMMGCFSRQSLRLGPLALDSTSLECHSFALHAPQTHRVPCDHQYSSSQMQKLNCHGHCTRNLPRLPPQLGSSYPVIEWPWS